MATANSLINSAFAYAGVKGQETPITAAEGQDGLELLNDLLAEWSATGALKYADPVYNVADEVKVPRYTEGALKANLAGRLCALYGLQVTPELAAAIQQQTAAMLAAGFRIVVDPPDNLPVGAGHMGQEYDFPTFFPGNPGERNF